MSKKLPVIVVASVAAAVVFGLVFSAIVKPDFDNEERLKLACRWVDDGRWDLANRLVQDLEGELADVDNHATWQYVKGAALLARVADDFDNYQHRRILFEATKCLEKSRELGFPVGYRAKGNFCLGVCLYNTYRWQEAIGPLNESLKEYPEVRSQALQMMVAAHLRLPVPDLEAANKVLQQWRRLPGISAREVTNSDLAEAQIALKRGDMPAVYQALAQVPAGIPEHYHALKLQALARLHESMLPNLEPESQRKLLDESYGILQKLLKISDTPNEVRRQAYYLMGRVQRSQGLLRECIGTFSAVRQFSPFSAEAIAAGLEEAEVLQELDRDVEILTATRQLLRGISDIQLFNAYWLSVDELRVRLAELGDKLRIKEKFDLAIELANQLGLAFPIIDSVRLQANSLANWASTVERDRKANDPESRQRMQQLFGQAGEKYEQLATLELRSKDYLTSVWNAAENYRKAQQLDSANRMLNTYLKFEQRSRRARGLLALGRNLIAASQWSAGLEPLQRCLGEYPLSPSSYEARFLAARALSEMGHSQQAIELLEANLWDYDLHPDSSVWRDSFFELGNLLYKRGQRMLETLNSDAKSDWSELESQHAATHQELVLAINQLSEAAGRYPDDARYCQVRYQLARSYQLAAHYPEQVLKFSSAVTAAAKRRYRQQRTELLEKAVGEYQELQRTIQAQREAAQQQPLDQSLLRSAYFGAADVLQELGRYELAIESLKTAAGHYANQPEALEALVQIAQCQRKLGRDDDAQKTIRQAELVLQRIPAEYDAIFVSCTRGDRPHWQQLLGCLREWH